MKKSEMRKILKESTAAFEKSLNNLKGEFQNVRAAMICGGRKMGACESASLVLMDIHLQKMRAMLDSMVKNIHEDYWV